jgi:predicted DNA-binding transcriptional regulator YafY
MATPTALNPPIQRLSNAGKNQLKLLKVLEILMSKTDENHPLGVRDIMDLLEQDGISTERKSIYQYIKLLESHGVDIITDRQRQNKYFIGSRQFELPELKLLIDAVLAAKFISVKKSDLLINKLVTMASIHQAIKLKQQAILTRRPKTDNEKILLVVNELHEALAQGRQVKFKYFDTTIHHTKRYRKDGAYYTVSPVTLVWDDDKYYLITFNPTYHKFVTYRIDKMEHLELTQLKAVDVPAELDLNGHVAQIFSMFGGQGEQVTLKVHQRLIDTIRETFGQNVVTLPLDAEHFSIQVDVQLSPTFYGWLFTFGDQITILNPPSVITAYKHEMAKTLALYP